MKMLVCLLAASAAFTQNWQPNVTNFRFDSRKFSGDLASDIRLSAGTPVWFGYAAKTTRHDGNSCCADDSKQCGCHLEGARATITNNSDSNATENDPDTQVKKQAGFALSQLLKDEGVPKLIDVARTQRNREVRKQAFFWLGQSQDPRALAFIEEVLTR